MRAYYDARAAEYDDWYLGTGLFASRDRPGWDGELAALTAALTSLPPARTLDVACGTAFLTRHLRGLAVGLDQSPEMVALAQARLPEGVALVGDALDLPFADGTFERVFTGHFYGHLPTSSGRRSWPRRAGWRASSSSSTRPSARTARARTSRSAG